MRKELTLTFDELLALLDSIPNKLDKKDLSNISSFSDTEKQKLAGIEAKALVNVIENIQVDGTNLEINNKTVNITKSSLNLNNVNNTSDLDKPISTAVQNALSYKADKETTLAGYGIADAKIANGVITLGSNTIAPITDISSKADQSSLDATNNNVSTNATNISSIQSTINGYGNVVTKNVATKLEKEGENIPTDGLVYAALSTKANSSTVNQLNTNMSTLSAAVAGLKITEIKNTTDASSVTINVATNVDNKVTISAATESSAGVMTGAQVTTLNKKADKATTLEGYGITDAKIENGNITLGTTTVTPLTSDSTVTWNKLTDIPESFTPSSHNQEWSTITNTPTTLAGYGITDAVSSSDNNGFSSNDYTNEDKSKLSGIESGAEVNIIEKILADGTELEITDKTVNITKVSLGLDNIDNTSDKDKPISNATQKALDNIVYITATTTNLLTSNEVTEDDITTYTITIPANSEFTLINNIPDKINLTCSYEFFTSGQSGLLSVTKTGGTYTLSYGESHTCSKWCDSDYTLTVSYPSSTSKVRLSSPAPLTITTYTEKYIQASSTKIKNYDAHLNNKSNPHNVTKELIGLDNVDNTSDLNKPISTATQTALNDKADKGTTLASYGITDAVLSSDSRLTDSRTPKAHTHLSSDITDLSTNYISTDKIGVANGIVPLDANTKISNDYINENRDSDINGKKYIVIPDNISIDDLSTLLNTYTNTIFELRYNIDLNASTIEIGVNNTLLFTGCILSNGTLVGNRTSIIASLNQIFNTNIVISGDWNVSESYPEWFGAVGDFSTNDTIAILTALNSFSCIKFINKYLSGQLEIPNNRIVVFASNSQLKEYPGTIGGTDDKSCMILEYNKENIIIYGNHATITMLKSSHESENEWNHGISLMGSHNIKIYDLNIIDAGGDGIYIGGNTYNENILISGCFTQGSKRNGISIVNAKNLLVLNCKLTESSGALNGPWAGIDIESNPDSEDDYDYWLENITILGCSSYGNSGNGLRVTPLHHKTAISCDIINFVSNNDVNGLGISEMLQADSSEVKLEGQICIRDVMINEPKLSGIYISNLTELCPTTKLYNIVIRNVGSAENISANRYKSAIIHRTENRESMKGTSDGNIIIDGLKVIDDRSESGTFAIYYAELPAYTTNPLKNVTIQNIKYAEGLCDNPFVITNGSGSFEMQTENINFESETSYEISGTMPYNKYYGTIKITATKSCVLPPKGNTLGSKIKIVGSGGITTINSSSGEYLYKNGVPYTSFRFINGNTSDYVILEDTAIGWVIKEYQGIFGIGNSDTALDGARISRGTYLSDATIYCLQNTDIMLTTQAHNKYYNSYGWVNRSGVDGTSNIKYLPPVFSLPFEAWTSANVPSPTSDDVGYVWFNTTLKKPLWWTGAGWVDATGATITL